MSKYKARLKRLRRRDRARAREAAKAVKPQVQLEMSPIAKLILQKLDERFDRIFGTAHDGLIAGLKNTR